MVMIEMYRKIIMPSHFIVRFLRDSMRNLSLALVLSIEISNKEYQKSNKGYNATIFEESMIRKDIENITEQNS